MLLLVSPIYMLQIYDRVITSGSFDALLWLTVIAVFLLAVYGAAEAGRRRSLALAGSALETGLAPKIFSAFERIPGSGLELERDLRRLRQVKAQFEHGGLLPWIDLPFAPLFIVVLFFIHPLLGAFGLVGAVLVLAVALVAELSTRQSNEIASGLDGEVSDFVAGLSRQRSALVAMGLVPSAFRKWALKSANVKTFSEASGRANNAFAAAARAVRQSLQVGILAAGAALALSQEVSLGAIVAGSIILARALAPIDQIVGGWRQSAQARRALDQIGLRVTNASDAQASATSLPRPEPILKLDRLSIAAPGSDQPLLRPFSFEISEGHIVALLGPNGCGKTCLLQTLAGAWPTLDGQVVLGGRSVHDWEGADRGRHVGYVPQEVEIFPGTVRENISRFTECEDADLFKASMAASAHEFILSLPDGYETVVGTGGRHLSAGQRQLIGLARALFGDPVVLLLDEPTANLDSGAVTAFLKVIKQTSQAGVMVIAATHDIRFVQASNTSLVIKQGSVIAADSQKYLAAITPNSDSSIEKQA
ncbi:ATP-binding cassette domain-containing protein [Maricaulaceae bacterium EIL42A08]|nr:ATP-binding cassette domain-containing protein [Maricaulaceae bacterium EIL42A08]